MRLSSLADYAVVLMSAAARQCGASAVANGGTGRQSARKLSQETGIPLPTAQKLVSHLAAADLLDSTRGAGGGIRLARPPATITLTQIVEAVDGPIAVTSCLEAGHSDCMLASTCTVKPHWAVVNGAIRNALDAVTLADLVRAPQISAPKSDNPQAAMEPHL
ncbi:RrF2 family transcriptional regulator [Alterisphingorhabdus coralli]|uniref:Rrf2 family transcriptional regulator n=1 Tax=Alterisphingorhabdus coralli TaxID=3071408 RepID=A0AA97F946_9SPHN|nr:Rrf2 family transcriptional regulator [Parasphingorhabdus sp. SCSIO 66989]WOE75312.1 Rrf2 family transcriptional regulator [Parasphingorhabdus sp. SCSIO 66989]